ncbi:Neurotrypsin [Bagarius yarrelli]|uniref:Neurotrypsin n=1 Tax=Bagarius yarrelli TaxID=175774 RepID=A0A556UG40_BAGYA|nr:Neurotrypsin [Bagarius yarrelli]
MEASARTSFLPLVLLFLLWVSPACSFLNPFSECAPSRGRGASYRGSVDVTESGARCMNWSEVSGVTARYPGKGLGEHNFCRNPDARIRPWCFFRNARGRIDWGYCDCKQGIPLRLVGGENEREGRVEILVAGQWGTICDDGWTDEDAEVVCRQLGYRGEAKARVMAYFGEGHGPIHFDNVKCTGAERSLTDCIKQPIGSHNCRHSEDAGVICNYGQWNNSTRVKGPHTREERGLLVDKIPYGRQKETSLNTLINTWGGWPWQVAVRLRGSQSDGRLVCGATLISSCWVLTSAHCFKRYGNSTSTYKIRVGDYHTLVPEEHEDEYGVERIILHPRYRPHSNDYDLALVRLNRHGGHGGHSGKCVRQTHAVLPVCLPAWRERAPKDITKCYITGWGDTGRAYSKTLQQAALTILSKRHCERHYGNQLTSRMLCAGSALSSRHVDSCRGDSGGPLVCEKGGGWVVYGVTSWGHACRLQDSPGVYTKVSAFIPWIAKVTSQ